MDAEFERLGRLLWAEGVILHEELSAALEQSGIGETALGKELARSNHIRMEELASFLGADYRIPFVASLEEWPADGADALLPRNVAEHNGIAPLCKIGEILIVAMADPPTPQVVADLRAIAGGKVKVVMSSAQQVQEVLQRAYGTRSAASSAAAEEDTKVLPKPAVVEAGASIEPHRLTEDEIEQLRREHDGDIVARWERTFIGDGPLEPTRIR